MKAFDAISSQIRNATYVTAPSDLKIHRGETYEDAKDLFKNVKLQPGYSVFFWYKKINYIDHIAIVPKQSEKDLNLADAKLLHGTPPPAGVGNGPLGNDYSGIRLCSLPEYIAGNHYGYAKIIVGRPPKTTEAVLNEAGRFARQIGETGIVDGKPAFYSLPIINKLLYVKSFNYDTHGNAKISFARKDAKKVIGSGDFDTVYCGDVVGRVYDSVGINNVPKATVLGISEYRSSTFYEWFRENNALTDAVVWGEQKDDLF